MARNRPPFKPLRTVGACGRRLGIPAARRIFLPMEEPRKPEPKPPAELPAAPPPPREIGGPPGPEPTRHGDWHYKGRCTDF